MKPECQALLLQEQLNQIQQALSALLIKNGAQAAPTQPTEPPAVVYRNVVETRRSGARRAILKLLNTQGPTDVYSISRSVYGDGTHRNLTRMGAVLYVLRAHRMVEWEGPLRPSTKITQTRE